MSRLCDFNKFQMFVLPQARLDLFKNTALGGGASATHVGERSETVRTEALSEARLPLRKTLDIFVPAGL